MSETPKEAVLFMMSMSETMGFLMPAPIEMDSVDEFHKEDERKSRWAMCSEMIRLMVNQLAGCPIDVMLAKNSELGVSVTRGNSKDRIHPVINLLQTLSTLSRSNGRCNPEFAVREFDKMMANEEYEEKSIHWFIDVETFLSFDPSVFNRNFEKLKIYVVGELRTLHDEYENAKKTCLVWRQSMGASVRLMVCGADFEQLKEEILASKRYEMSEMTVPCFLGRDEFEVQLLSRKEYGSPSWQCDAISIVGFPAETELCRLSALGQRCQVGHIFNVSSESEIGNDILYSLANFMLSDTKTSMTCLCKCLKDGKLLEYGILVADAEVNQLGLSLFRLGTLSSGEELELRAVEMIGEASESLPDEAYVAIAPLEHRVIKRRLAEVESSTDDSKRIKFERLADEYQVLGVRDAFDAFTSAWQKEHL